MLIVVAGLVTGALYPLNTWDYPTYLLLTFVAIFVLDALGSAAVAHGSEETRWRVTFAVLRRAAITAMAVLVVGRLIFWPYFASYQPQFSVIDPWREPSTVGQFLTIHGLWLFILVSAVVIELFGGPALVRRRSDRALPDDETAWQSISNERVIGAIALIAAIASIAFDSLDGLLLSLLIVIAIAAWQRLREPLMLWIWSMAAVAVLIALCVEHYVLRGDIGRMNTVFKFYLQVWILLSLASAVLLLLVIARTHAQSGWLGRAPWTVLLAVLLGASMVYPVYATSSRIEDRFGDAGRTLNGMAFMETAVYGDAGEGMPVTQLELRQDLQAIEWLRANVRGSPVILEAVTPLYRWGSRVSVYTGLPTVIGWDWHQSQQRPGFQSLIDARKDHVQQMLGEVRTIESIRPLLDRYHVRYIYVGPLERAYYQAEALAKFEQAVESGHVTLVYDDDGVRIYRYDG
jgi:YYY domain-containing protein